MNKKIMLALAGGAGLILAGCSTPAHVGSPGGKTARAYHEAGATLGQLPPPKLVILSGDTLRIVRDAREPAEADDMTLFQVRPDGMISVPDVGSLQVAGLTPEDVAEKITAAYARTYREPTATVNIAIAPSNRVFVGGAVPNAAFFDLTGTATLEQVLMASGGVLPSADMSKVALLRLNAEGRYDTYFFDLSSLLKTPGRTAVVMQRGDLVYVPQSGIGRTVEAIDMYFTRLFPINKGIGVGFNYDLNSKGLKNSGNTTNTTINNINP